MLFTCINMNDFLPFVNVPDDELSEVISNSFSCRNVINHDLNFKSFQYTEYDHQHDNHLDIDPDANFFFDKVNFRCNYYTDEIFKSNIKNHDGFSIIHFNCRSLNAIFFKLIQLSE